jgi:hypothetical protein
VFPPGTSQDQVFEDTKHLVQSAVDGYNVCIFAYGQTGSGKTFTIYGNERAPGLTPRGVTELFRIIHRDSGKYTFSVSVYMLELYQVSERLFLQHEIILRSYNGLITVNDAGFAARPAPRACTKGLPHARGVK